MTLIGYDVFSAEDIYLPITAIAKAPDNIASVTNERLNPIPLRSFVFFDLLVGLKSIITKYVIWYNQITMAKCDQCWNNNWCASNEVSEPQQRRARFFYINIGAQFAYFVVGLYLPCEGHIAGKTKK